MGLKENYNECSGGHYNNIMGNNNRDMDIPLPGITQEPPS
jgi:hypothetical protein